MIKKILLIIALVFGLLGMASVQDQSAHGAASPWTEVYNQDFSQTVANGTWPGPYLGNVYAYDGCCSHQGPSGVTYYNPRQSLTVHDGVLDMFVMKVQWPGKGWVPLGSGISPTIPGGDEILHGRITVTLGIFPGGTDSMRSWSLSNLLISKFQWADGEVNWPEGALDNQTPVAFVHQIAPGDPHINCNGGQFNKAWKLEGWHKYTIDWYPWGWGFFRDDVPLGGSNCALPTKPMNHVIQVVTLGADPSANSWGHVYVDKITVDRYTG